MLYLIRSGLGQSSLILGLSLSEILFLLLFSAVLISLFLLFTSAEMDIQPETSILVSNSSLVYKFSSYWTFIAGGWIPDAWWILQKSVPMKRLSSFDSHVITMACARAEFLLTAGMRWALTQCTMSYPLARKPLCFLSRLSHKPSVSSYFQSALLYHPTMLRQTGSLFKKQKPAPGSFFLPQKIVKILKHF